MTSPSPSSSLVIIFLAMAPILFDLKVAHAATKRAPAPTPAPLNLTGILEKGGQYTTLIRMMRETQIGEQIESQLNNSYGGLTLFAPTDKAFAALKPGTLNGLTAQEQVSLVLYHVLPRYYSFEMFQTVSNPVRTQATGNNGIYTLNITSTDTNKANVSTGIDQTRIDTALHSTFPFAVFSVDKVLLPYDLFGPKPPASAPAPVSAADDKNGTKTPSASSARAPSAAAEKSPSAASFQGRSVGWSFVVGVGLVSVGTLLL